LPEKEHSRNEKDRVNNAGNDDPPEKPVLTNKKPGIFPALDGYNYFFEQSLNLRSKYSEWAIVNGE
jgi:hypothetical protein